MMRHPMFTHTQDHGRDRRDDEQNSAYKDLSGSLWGQGLQP
jgi:hypothetical protein